MAHIEEGMLQAYLDAEVGASAEIERHLAQCAACTGELERLRSASQLFAAVIRAADVAPPALAARSAFRAARRPVAARRFAMPRVPLARAALLVFGLAAIASATIPGSPVRAWITDALRAVGRDVEPDGVGPTQVVAPPAAPVEATPGAAAVSVAPADGRILVYLAGAQQEITVLVRLVDTDRASVQLAEAAPSARFRTGPGRIEVLGVRDSEVVVEVPRAARDARVEVDGRLVFRKDGSQLHVDGARPVGESEFIFHGRR